MVKFFAAYLTVGATLFGLTDIVHLTKCEHDRHFPALHYVAASVAWPIPVTLALFNEHTETPACFATSAGYGRSE